MPRKRPAPAQRRAPEPSTAVRLTPGGNHVPRPRQVELCPACAVALGAGYPSCPTCFTAVERLWDVDWQAFLAAEGVEPGSPKETALARRVVDEREQHRWTVLDAAIVRLRCAACGAELGGGPVDCAECTFAFGNLWGLDDSDPQQDDLMPGNGHALRVGRYVLRHPHRYSELAVASWRYSVPRLLTGWLPTTAEAQRLRARLNKLGLDALRDGAFGDR